MDLGSFWQCLLLFSTAPRVNFFRILSNTSCQSLQVLEETHPRWYELPYSHLANTHSLIIKKKKKKSGYIFLTQYPVESVLRRQILRSFSPWKFMYLSRFKVSVCLMTSERVCISFSLLCGTTLLLALFTCKLKLYALYDSFDFFFVQSVH